MMAELTGVLQALMFAREAGWNRVLIETDSTNVELALKLQSYDLASCGMLTDQRNQRTNGRRCVSMVCGGVSTSFM